MTTGEVNALVKSLGEAMQAAVQESPRISELIREFKARGLDVLLFLQAEVAVVDTVEFTADSDPIGGLTVN